MLNKITVAGRVLVFTMVMILTLVGFSQAEVMEIQNREEPTYIEMVPGDNKKLTTDHNLKRIVVGDPDIVEVKVLDKNRVSIIAKGLGNSGVTFTGSTESEVTNIYVHVAPDVISLKQRISELFPGQNIKVYANKNGIILAGTVTGAEIVEQVLRLTQQMMASPSKESAQPQVEVNRKVKSTATDEELAQIIADTKEVTVEAKLKSSASATGTSSVSITNLMKVSGSQQVLLEVKFAEVNRSSSRNLQAGLGFGKLGDDFRGIFGPRAIGLNNNGVTEFGASLTPTLPGPEGTIGAGIPGQNFDADAIDFAGSLLLNLAGQATNVFMNIDNVTLALEFLESENLARTLAEPRLVTLSGQEASFLAGGEYPVQSIDENGNPDTEFKEFGVGLRFTPIVNSNGTITLKVNPSVSDITELVEKSTGFDPVLSTRKLDSTVQIKDGQTLVLAGLLKDNLREVVSKVPFLGDIPYIGALFRSSGYQQDKTDLLIAVTPHLVTPVHEGSISYPGEFIKPPNRYEFYLEGRLEGRRTANDPSQFIQHNFSGTYSSLGGLEGDFGHMDNAQ